MRTSNELVEKKAVYFLLLTVLKRESTTCACGNVHRKQFYRGDRKESEKFATREALNLAREYYENPRVKREDVRATKLVDMEGISRKFNINIRIFEPEGGRHQLRYAGRSLFLHQDSGFFDGELGM